MITELTTEQEAQLEVYAKKWIEIGLSTTEVNKPKAEDAARRAYKEAGLVAPDVFIWADSPNQGAIFYAYLEGLDQDGKLDSFLKNGDFSKLNTLTKQDVSQEKIKESLNFTCYGQQDAAWLSFYSYFADVIKIKECERLRPLMDLAEECGWWMPFDKVCLMQEKPIKVSMKGDQLHNEEGPAILYKDGFAIYSLNGIRVEDWVVMTPASDLDPKKVLAMENVEVRRELVRKIGVERLITKLGAKTIDSKTVEGHPYELLLVDLGEQIGNIPYLKMLNPSIDTWHVEAVVKACTTVEMALNARNGFPLDRPFLPPKELT